MENKRLENQLKAIQERIRAITEAVESPLKGIQKKLEPVQEQLSQLLPRLQQAAILLQNRIDEAELEYPEIANFYQDWKGKTPPRFKRFLDWFFEVNDDKSLGELLEHPFEVKEEDLEQAGLWLLNRIEFEGVKTKLERLGLKPEEIEYLEAVNNAVDAAPMSVKNPALAREYVKGITSQMEGFSYEAQAIVLEDVSKYFKKLPEGQVWLKPSIWIRNAIEQYLAELNQSTKEQKPAPQALTFEGLFKFRPDFSRAMKLLEAPLPDDTRAIKAGSWVYAGKSEKALIVAFADVLKEKLSIHASVSADDITQAFAQYLGIELPDRVGRARWKGGVRKNGEAYDYSEFRKHFLTKL